MAPPKPLIIVDGRSVGPIPHGMSRYITCMARGLAMRERERRLPYEIAVLVGEKTPVRSFSGFRTVPASAGFLSPGELLEIPRILERERAALYHSPTFSSLLRCPCPWIATVHDLNHLKWGGLRERVYYRLLLKRFAASSKALITVSEFSRSELRAWIPGKEIEIVSNAIEPTLLEKPSRSESILSAHGLVANRYFFCLSNAKPHKNVALLIEAYGLYRKLVPDPFPLVINVDLSKSLPAESRQGVLVLPEVGEEAARALSHGAAAIVFPSLYEGFGLPPVEGAAIGRPILVSDIPVHREALASLKADEACWLDPRSPEVWAEGMKRAHSGQVSGPSSESRRKLHELFSLDRMGRDMDRIYRRVLGITLEV